MIDRLRYLCAHALLALLFACSPEQVTPPDPDPLPPPPPPPQEIIGDILIAAGNGSTTYTIFDGGATTSWLESDRMGVFLTYRNDSVGPRAYRPVPGSIAGNNAMFQGSLSWMAPNTSHTFWAYYPFEGDDTQWIDPHRVPVSLPIYQEQEPQYPTRHIGELDFLYAHPVSVVSPASGVSQDPLQMRFSHLFALVEFRVRADSTFDTPQYIEWVQLASDLNNAQPLSVTNAEFDLTRDYAPGEIAGAIVGRNSETMIQVNVLGNDLDNRRRLPTNRTNDPPFVVWGMVLPGVHEANPDGVIKQPLKLTVEVEGPSGDTLKFTTSHQRLDNTTFVAGQKYTFDITAMPTSTTWDGTVSEGPPPLRDTVLTAYSTATGSIVRYPATGTMQAYMVSTPNELYWLSLHSHPDSAETWDIRSGNIVLLNDIDLADIPWYPIGRTGGIGSFAGHFFGLNHIVSGLSVSENEPVAGLFGYLGDGAYVQDLHLAGNISSAAEGASVGGLFGNTNSTAQIVYNVSFDGTVEAPNGSAGGIGGSTTGGDATTLHSCFSAGLVRGRIAGGIVGSNGGGNTIISPINRALIQATQMAGGIVGNFANTGASSLVSNAQNYGNISCPGGVAGGIIGQLTQGDASFLRCMNRGSVTAFRAGGILGVGSTMQFYVRECANHGDITGGATDGGMAAGLVGSGNVEPFENSYNRGRVDGYRAAGFIVDLYIWGGPSARYCYNSGALVSRGGGSNQGAMRLLDSMGLPITWTTLAITSCFYVPSAGAGVPTGMTQFSATNWPMWDQNVWNLGDRNAAPIRYPSLRFEP